MVTVGSWNPSDLNSAILGTHDLTLTNFVQAGTFLFLPSDSASENRNVPYVQCTQSAATSPPPWDTFTTGFAEKRPISPMPVEVKKKPGTTRSHPDRYRPLGRDVINVPKNIRDIPSTQPGVGDQWGRNQNSVHRDSDDRQT